jgi:hypothetical protein
MDAFLHFKYTSFINSHGICRAHKSTRIL